MKFLLLTFPEEWEQPGILGHPPNYTTIYPPLGLLYIGSSLENQGHQVDIIDLGFENIFTDKLEVNLNNYDAIGISVFTNTFDKASYIAKTIKNQDPEKPIIIGGPHCIFLKQQSLNDVPDADIAVCLEGEQTIIDIVDCLQGKKNYSNVNGIYYKQNNKIKNGKPFRLVKNLDSLSFPARHLVEKYDYGNFPWGYSTKKKFTSMITSRGCNFHCRFCSRYNNVIPGYGFRQRSAENVIEEIIEINQKYSSVAIVDDNFLADKKRSHKIFNMIIEQKIDLDIIIVGARVDSADNNLYKKMKKAGVTCISYGIESGNQDILDYYNKDITLDQIRKAIKIGRENGFFLSASLIFGGPTENKDHIKNTIKFICSLPLDNIVIRPFYFDMGSELWREAVQKGKISKNEYVVSSDSKRGTGLLTFEEIQRFQRQAFKKFFLRPSYLFQQMYRSIKGMDITRIKSTIKILKSSQIKNII